MDIGLLNHRHESLLGRAPRLQETGKVVSLPQLWDFQRDPAGPGVPITLPVAAPLNLAQRRMRASRAQGRYLPASQPARSAPFCTRSSSSPFSVQGLAARTFPKIGDDRQRHARPRAASYAKRWDTISSPRKDVQSGLGLTAGQARAGQAADKLLDQLSQHTIVPAGKDDTDRIRTLIEEQGATLNIPAKSNRRWKPWLSKHPRAHRRCHGTRLTAPPRCATCGTRCRAPAACGRKSR